MAIIIKWANKNIKITAKFSIEKVNNVDSDQS